MSLQKKIEAFITSPFPVWENNLTIDLVDSQWKAFEKYEIWPENYTTARALFWDSKLEASERKVIITNNHSHDIQLEAPQQILQPFYNETGLELLDIDISKSKDAEIKIIEAFNVLDKIPEIQACLQLLIKTIQVLKQDDPEIDTSHSDPEIPFSIFISVCEDSSPISNLRVAESILHEAMHLKLTLIEKHIDLIVPGTQETFYSPWRDQQRPVRGVLHGLFVFNAIYNFYCSFSKKHETHNFIQQRIKTIHKEINYLSNFHMCSGLTENGKKLSINLLQLEN